MNAYKKKKPGLYFPYKCKKGDETKLFPNSLQSGQAVCNGLYIPFGIKLGKTDYVKVLAKMEELNSKDNTLKKDMKKLAELSIKQINITT